MFPDNALRPDEFIMCVLVPPYAAKKLTSRYPLDHYKMTEREAQPEEDNSVPGRISRLEVQYKESGIRRSVDAVMVVQVRGFPHVLVLQVANAFYKLPGGYLDPSETDAAGLATRLNEQLGIPKEHDGLGNKYHQGGDHSWYIKDCLSVWWRPNFDTFFYPYLPPHVSEPKEIKKLYLVELPASKTFAVPANMKLLAIPIMEFYDNAARYGPQFAGLPYVLGRYWLPAHQTAADLAMEHTDFEHHF